MSSSHFHFYSKMTPIYLFDKEVKRQMAEQVKEDPSKYYWTEQIFKKDDRKTNTCYAYTKFYLNKEHQLVLTFLNTKLLLVMGTPEFVIPKSVTKRFWHRKIIWIINEK